MLTAGTQALRRGRERVSRDPKGRETTAAGNGGYPNPTNLEGIAHACRVKSGFPSLPAFADRQGKPDENPGFGYGVWAAGRISECAGACEMSTVGHWALKSSINPSNAIRSARLRD